MGLAGYLRLIQLLLFYFLKNNVFLTIFLKLNYIFVNCLSFFKLVKLCGLHQHIFYII
jgi:hypothetical protein